MVQAWASLFSNSALLRTLVGFVHIAGLVIGGGSAIAADWGTITAYRTGLDRTARLDVIRRAHRGVVGGLAAIIVSGLLLFASDTDTYVHSRVFWVKMGLVAVLLVNGAILTRLAARRTLEAKHWTRLAIAASVSLGLWLVITLAGAALPNI